MPDNLIIHSLPELSAYSSSWNMLTVNPLTPAQLFEWVEACALSLCNKDALRIHASNVHNQPVSFAPLCLAQKPVRHLQFLGSRQLGEPVDFIYHDIEALKYITRSITGARLPVVLNRMPADSPVPRIFRQTGRGRGLTIVRKSSSYPYIGLPADPENSQPLLTSHLRSDIRRGLNKANKAGQVRFQSLADINPADLDTYYNIFLEIEALSWKGENKTALRYDETRNHFFSELCSNAARAGILRFFFMLIDDIPAAGVLALLVGNRLWLLKIAYDQRFRHCSPGLLLVKHTVDYALQNRLDSYEFLGHTEAWTRRWTKTERETIRVTFYPYNVKGTALLMYEFFSKAKKRIGLHH